MALRPDESLRIDGVRKKKIILSSCVKLFLEKGYKDTTIHDIIEDSGCSASSFTHYFGAKDGVLTELLNFMYGNQFDMARATAGQSLPPIYTYADECAIQLALCDLNEHIRDVYVEAYTHQDALDIIQKNTAHVLYETFGSYQPELTEKDFYHIDLGTSGMMRGYMSAPSTEDFMLEEKVRLFTTAALRALKVPEDEVAKVVGHVLSLDLRSIALKVMDALFHALAMRYDFSLEGIPLTT